MARVKDALQPDRSSIYPRIYSYNKPSSYSDHSSSSLSTTTFFLPPDRVSFIAVIKDAQGTTHLVSAEQPSS